jgi:putative ABC transport system permease protein
LEEIMGKLIRRLQYFFRYKRAAKELAEEIEFHRALRQQELEQAGLSERDAIAASRRVLGNTLVAGEDARGVWIWPSLEQMWRDIAYGARVLWKSPALTIAAVLTLAIGIGATTAVFELVNAISLKPLPVSNPDELVWFGFPSFSRPVFKQVQARSGEIFASSFAWTLEPANAAWDHSVEEVQALFVSGEFYRTLGITTAIGRSISLQDETDAATVAVISHNTWQQRFAGDPDIIGKQINVDRVPLTIIGVDAAGFFGVSPGVFPALTVPLTTYSKLKPLDGPIDRPTASWLHLMARLKPGITGEQANSAVQVFWPQIMESVAPASMRPQARQRLFLDRRTQLMAGATGDSAVRRQFSQILSLLFAFVGFLLLLACASVANLLLARATGRQREVLVRTVLGASRRRLAGQFMTEGLLLAFIGTVAALVPARLGASIIVAMLQTKDTPVALDLSTDWTTAAFTVMITILTAILFTLAPILQIRTGAIGLQEASRTIIQGAQRWRLGKALVVAQVGFAVLLIAGGLLFARNLLGLVSSDAGFDYDKLLLVNTDPVGAGYRDERLAQFYRQLVGQIEAVPGVESVSFSQRPPLSNEMGSTTDNITAADGVSLPQAADNRVSLNVVSPRYFATIGQWLLRGREFEPRDANGGTAIGIVSESLARDVFPNQDPIGRRISIGDGPRLQNMEIIGVVRDAKYQLLQEPFRKVVYLPYIEPRGGQNARNFIVEVRMSVPVESGTAAIRTGLAGIDPSVLIRLETVPTRIRESLVAERAMAVISMFLGAVALILAVTSLYGLLAYSVTRRTNEIGIRMVLGARRQQILWSVLRDALMLCLLGAIAGGIAAVALSRYASTLVYGIRASDPVIPAAAAVLMLLVGLTAAYLPALRATRTNPIVALRHE